jgi:hypothetical protein
MIKYYIEYHSFYDDWNHKKRILRIFRINIDKYEYKNNPWITADIIYNKEYSKTRTILKYNSLKNYYEVPEDEIDELLVTYGI